MNRVRNIRRVGDITTENEAAAAVESRLDSASHRRANHHGRPDHHRRGAAPRLTRITSLLSYGDYHIVKVTRTLQVTLPRAIADRYGIRPGDDIQWRPAGTVLQIVPTGKTGAGPEPGGQAEGLKLFDATTIRQKLRQRRRVKSGRASDRRWKRQDASTRNRARQ